MLASGKPAGTHTVEIMKRTEAIFGIVRFEGFTFTGGTGLLAPPAHVARKIEFLGDSTIDGYGIEGDFATTCKVDGGNGAPPQFDEARKSVAWKTSVGLGAELHLLGYSGKGSRATRTRWRPTRSPSSTRVRSPTSAAARGRSHRTSRTPSWWPSAAPTTAAIRRARSPRISMPTYAALLGDIRGHYGASTYIFLTVWSQYKAYDGVRQAITAAIDAAIAGRPAGEKNYKLVLPEADFATDETACQLHANDAHHTAMAAQLISGIKAVTMWP